jgi:hypothetical protein
MTFVYQGAGKKQGKDVDDPCLLSRKCKVMACDIQYCLSRNSYQQIKCEHVIDRWKACCEEAKAQADARRAETATNSS